jgi:hypothetical protein
MDSLSQYAGIQHASLRIQSGTRYDESEPHNRFKGSDVQQLAAVDGAFLQACAFGRGYGFIGHRPSAPSRLTKILWSSIGVA